MVILATSRLSNEDIQKVAEDLDGYIKFVVDIERGILAAGGTRHIQAEEVLLKNGSKQQDLWGGGLDLETGSLDFDSMINIRPSDNNTREVLSPEIRKKMESIARKLLR